MPGISSTVLLFSAAVLGQAGDPVVYQAPAIEVHEQTVRGPGGTLATTHRLLYYGIHWGFNYLPPPDPADWGNPDKDFSRMPTTYYHPQGPLGLALQKLQWFADPVNVYPSDARLAASLLGMGGDPLSQFAAVWSEPPVAVLGLGVGTEAAYARPYQTMHFFERNPKLIAASQSAPGQAPVFHFIRDARQRGAAVAVFPGEHRATFAHHGGRRFYHLIAVETVKESRHEYLHEDLLTREAMQALMDGLVEEGVLCYHTSHRFLDLDRILASVARDLGYAALAGRDMPDTQDAGHFSSSWVLIARRPEYLDHVKARTTIPDYWQVPQASDRYVWRDGKGSTFAGLWRSDPYVADAEAILRRCEGLVSPYVGGYQWAQWLTGPVRRDLAVYHRLVLAIRNR